MDKTILTEALDTLAKMHEDIENGTIDIRSRYAAEVRAVLRKAGRIAWPNGTIHASMTDAEFKQLVATYVDNVLRPILIDNAMRKWSSSAIGWAKYSADDLMPVKAILCSCLESASKSIRPLSNEGESLYQYMTHI